jgi:hypothetical protein
MAENKNQNRMEILLQDRKKTKKTPPFGVAISIFYKDLFIFRILYIG